MTLRSPSRLSRPLTRLATFLRKAWLGRALLPEPGQGHDWLAMLGLRRRQQSGLPRPTVRLGNELLESRETPDDLFGVLSGMAAFGGLGVSVAPLLAPQGVVARGWAGASLPAPVRPEPSAAPPPWAGAASVEASALSDAAFADWAKQLPLSEAGQNAAAPTGQAVPLSWAPGSLDGWAESLGDLTAPTPQRERKPVAPPPVPPSSGGGGVPSEPKVPGGKGDQPAGGWGPTGITPLLSTTALGSLLGGSPVLVATTAPTQSAATASAAVAPATANSAATESSANSDAITGGQSTQTSGPTAAYLADYGQTPLAFVPNVGQTDPSAQFVAQGAGLNVFLTDTGAVFSLARPDGSGTSDAFRMSVSGASTPSVVASDQMQSSTNYFEGSDPSQWHADVPNYAQVQYNNIVPGVDLGYHAPTTGGGLEYDLTVAPGADPSAIRLNWAGLQSVTTDAQGDLLLQTAGGTIVESAPVVYQQGPDGAHVAVASSQVIEPDGSVGFQVGSYDTSEPLVIDPTISFSTYLGGSGADKAYGVAVDAAGNSYITGSTGSTDFPTGVGAYSSSAGGTDAFVVKLNASGSGIGYSTYLGGAGTDVGNGIAVGLDGSIYVAGNTASTNFPTTSGAYETTHMVSSPDGFVARLSAAGDALLYSTFLGASPITHNATHENGIAVASDGSAYITGDSHVGTTSGAMVARLNALGTGLVFETYLSGDTTGNGIVLDSAGNAIVTGAGSSGHVFVAEVASSGTVSGTTSLGGSGTDVGYGIALTPAGDIYVTGSTTSTNFPTASAYQASLSGTQDAFVTALSPALGIIYSTYLGGTATAQGKGIAVDAEGYATVAGLLTASGFPTTAGAFQGSDGGGTDDAFVTRLTPTGTLSYSSYLGGSGDDEANAVALDPEDNAYVAGLTDSTDFPVTSGAYQGSNAGGYDAFVTKVLPTPPAPALLSISPDTGASSTDQITSSGNLMLSGTAVPLSTVTLFQAGEGAIGSVAASSGGTFTFDYTGTTLTEGTYAFTAQDTVGSLTSALSAPAFKVTVDTTAPTVTLTLLSGTSTATLGPKVLVSASELNGLPNGTTVALDVDLTDAGNFTGAGDANYATGTLYDGAVEIALPTLPSTGTYPMQARVTSLAGAEGTSATETLSVTSATTWTGTGTTFTVVGTGSDPQTQAGDAQDFAALDMDQSPGTDQSGNAGLMFNSDSVSVRPIVQVSLQSANNATLPSTITGTFVWDTLGTPTTSTLSWATTGASPGDVFTLAAQAPSALSSTGRYGWEMLLGTPAGVQTITGSVFAVATDGSGLGAGWILSNTSRLVTVSADANGPAGAYWIDGDGSWGFFTGTATFSSPAGYDGTLSMVGSGSTATYTYTKPDGEKIVFDGAGDAVEWSNADGTETIQTGYNGSHDPTSMTAIDGSLSTITYSTGQAVIAEPGGRLVTLSLDGSNNLTQITSPDGGLHTFAYDAYHRLTGETFGGLQNEWAYTSAGLLSAYTWGSVGSPSQTTITPAAGLGLGTPVVGSPFASSTDGAGHTGQTLFNAQGDPTTQIAPDGGVSTSGYTNGFLTAATDVQGNTTNYALDSANQVTQVTLPDGSTMTMAYQTLDHLVTSSTDELGNTTTYAYDTYGRLTSSTDAAGDTTTYGYNLNDLLTSTTDALGHTTTYGYDSYRRLTSMTDPLGNTTLYGYDSYGNLQTVTDPRGYTTTTLYDPMGRATATIDALGDRTTTTFDAAGLELSFTNELGVLTCYVYDNMDRGLQTEEIDGVGTANEVISLTDYDNDGNATATRDGMGNWAMMALDSNGQVTGTTDALGDTTQDYYNQAGQELTPRDGLGNASNSAYNNRGWETTQTDAQGGVSTMLYDKAGNVTAQTDALGNTTTTLYDSLNRATATIDSLGGRTTTTFDATGNVSTVTDSLGNVTSYVYDLDGRQTAVTTGVGTAAQATSYTGFDADGNVTTETDANGGVTTTLYDALDRPTVTIDSLGNRTTTAYDAAGNVTAVTDGSGTTTSIYDSLGRQIATTDALGNTTTTVLDANGNAAASIDALGNVSVNGINALGQNVASVSPNGALAQSTFDSADNPIQSVDANGNTTSTIYDSLGRPIVSFDALGNATTTTYDLAGNVSTVTNPLGDVTSYAYDQNNRQTAVTTAVGTSAQATTHTGYDKAGNVTTQTDALGHVTTTLYDAQNRPTVVIDPLGDRTTTTYDNNGNVSTVTDPLGDVTSYAYDKNNRQTAMTVGVGTAAQATTDTGYDSSGNVTTVTDPVGNVTTTLYDTANRPTVVIDALGNRTTTAYDANGNVTSVTDPDGRQILSSYDTNGRMTAATWLSGGTTVNLQTFTFDENGNELTAQDFSGTVTYTYDKDNRVQSYTNVFGLTLTYAYDQNNDVTLRQDSLGGTLTSTFDAAGRLQTREFSGTDAAGAAVRLDLGYTAANQLSTITHSTNLSGTLVAETTVEGYDNAGRVTAITNFNGSAATLSYYDYQYDKGSRVTTQTYQSAVGTVTFSAVVPYGYDSTNQLTSDGTSTYAFDLNGNRTSVVTGGVTATYSTGTNNELINDGTYTYTYDNAGNNIGKVAASGDTWAYSYDNENHLLSAVEKSDGVHVNFAVTYTYDVQGNRVEQDEWTSGTGVVTTRFNVDPLNGGNVWADTDSSNNVLVRYVFGDEPDQILSRTVASGANAGVWFYNVDNLGSVRDLVNASGVVEDHDDYTGFGVVTESNPSVGSRYGYTGGQDDLNTGFVLDGRREDDVATGSWITPDPTGFAAGDSDLYRYVGNNATNLTDPTGLAPKIYKLNGGDLPMEPQYKGFGKGRDFGFNWTQPKDLFDITYQSFDPTDKGPGLRITLNCDLDSKTWGQVYAAEKIDHFNVYQYAVITEGDKLAEKIGTKNGKAFGKSAFVDPPFGGLYKIDKGKAAGVLQWADAKPWYLDYSEPEAGKGGNWKKKWYHVSLAKPDPAKKTPIKISDWPSLHQGGDPVEAKFYTWVVGVDAKGDILTWYPGAGWDYKNLTGVPKNAMLLIQGVLLPLNKKLSATTGLPPEP